MKKLYALPSLALFLILLGCVSAGPPREIVYEQKDLIDVSAIEIRYRNQSSRKVCLPPGEWPNPNGAISDAESRAFLVVGSHRFAMRPFNGGYCLKNCSVVVSPGHDVVTRIPYEFFDLPMDLTRQTPKHLEFSARAYPCR
jgi:hypothetical protein